MDKVDLRENTNIEAITDEYSVEKLRQKFAEQESLVDLQQRELEIRQRAEKNYIEYLREKEESLQGFADTKEERLALETSISEDKENIRAEHAELKKAQKEQEELDLETKFAQQWLNQDIYAPAFAQLYRIKDLAKIYGEDAKINFQVIEDDAEHNYGFMTAGEHVAKSLSNETEPLQHLSLRVQLDDKTAFNIVMDPYDGNDARAKMRIMVDEDTLKDMDLTDTSKAKANKEKIKLMVEFCEKYGFPVTDLTIPYTFDGEVDNSAFDHLRDQLTEQQLKQQELQQQFGALFDEVKNDYIAAGNQKDEDELKEIEVEQERNKTILKEHPELSEEDLSVSKMPLETTDAEQEDVSAIEDLVLQQDASAKQEQKNGNSGQRQGVQLPNWLNRYLQNQQQRRQQNPQPQPLAKSAGPSMAEAEKIFEDMLHDGLGKQQDVTYRKKFHFFPSYTEYDVYDQAYAFKEDGKRKDGQAKFTYSCKLFIRRGKDGKLCFSYRTPNNKKIDESVIDAMCGAFKDMGYTHINFPAGVPNAEKGIWRKMLAEKGIVPRGMGLDRSKVEGMLEAAKKKLSSEQLAEYKYRLALEMLAANQRKGKKVDDSEQQFIDSLIKSHQYRAFTNGFAMTLKGKLTRILRTENQDTGAIDKIAAFRAMRRVFDVYKHAINGNGDILSSPMLTQEEKDKLAHNVPPIVGQAENLSPEQMGALYDILMKRCQEEAKDKLYKELIEVRESKVVGAKRADKIIIGDLYKAARNQCNSINDDLQAEGVDEIGLPKSFDVPMEFDQFKRDYEERVRQQNTNNPSGNSNSGQQNSGNNGGNDSNDVDTNSSMGSRVNRQINSLEY